MARIRSIKPAAFTSESLAEVSIAANWTFAGLWTYVDDEGRGKADPRLVKGQLYPLRDEVTPDVVSQHIAELESIGSVCRYSVGGREYLHVINFDEHQTISKPTPSKLPPCPLDHEAPDHDGDSLSPGESQGILDIPRENVLGTGNREQGSGTGNRERPSPGATPESSASRFPEFWAIYPLKNDRKPAEEKWDQVMRRGRVDPEVVIQAAIRYRDDPNRDPGYTKAGKSWLHQACWENGPLPPRRRNAGASGPAKSEETHSRLDSMKDPDPRTAPELRAIPGGF